MSFIENALIITGFYAAGAYAVTRISGQLNNGLEDNTAEMDKKFPETTKTDELKRTEKEMNAFIAKKYRIEFLKCSNKAPEVI